jgi:predicted nucleotidyltransferase
MMDRLVLENADAITRTARAHGAVRVRVFGSRARDEVRVATGSDLDLLVDLEPDRDLLDLVAVKQELEALLHCPVDVVTEGALSPALREFVLQEAKPL